MESLRITLKEALELNREDALVAAGDDFEDFEQDYQEISEHLARKICSDLAVPKP